MSETGTATGPETRRQTRQRAALATALESTAEFVSAQELHTRLAESGTKVGLATVYRNLQAMAADGKVAYLLFAAKTELASRRAVSVTRYRSLNR